MPKDARAIYGENYCIKVCEALGIDHTLVRSVDVRGVAGDVLTVTVEFIFASPVMDVDFPSADQVEAVKVSE